MARLAWASCVVVLAVGCSGSDFTPFFGGGGASGNAGSGSGTAGNLQTGSGGSSTVGSGGSGMNGAGGTTGTAGMTGSGGMTGAGGMTGTGGMSGTGNTGGSSGGGAGTNAQPDSGAAGAGGMGGARDAGMGGCTSNDSCPDASYCKKASCASDATGICTPKPKACKDDPEETPVCGCNGVTYFSSCLAEWSGENVSLHGICADQPALKCSNVNPACVNYPNGFCGYLVNTASSCPGVGGPTLSPIGRCWVLPDTCPEYLNHFNSCNGNTKCAHTCEAVKDERPYYRAGPGCN
jgi:Kazal-type serine protease inhibitor domain